MCSKCVQILYYTHYFQTVLCIQGMILSEEAIYFSVLFCLFCIIILFCLFCFPPSSIAFYVSTHHYHIQLFLLLYMSTDDMLLLLQRLQRIHPYAMRGQILYLFFFFKVLFLLICWTLRGECTFRSDQCPSNSYLKESHRKPWNSYKNLDCLLFIRFTRTLVFGYQALFKPPTVLSLLAFNSRGKH